MGREHGLRECCRQKVLECGTWHGEAQWAAEPRGHEDSELSRCSNADTSPYKRPEVQRIRDPHRRQSRQQEDVLCHLVKLGHSVRASTAQLRRWGLLCSACRSDFCGASAAASDADGEVRNTPSGHRFSACPTPPDRSEGGLRCWRLLASASPFPVTARRSASSLLRWESRFGRRAWV